MRGGLATWAGGWTSCLPRYVATGSELLYDGLSASFLDGPPLALAIGAHLPRPAIPETAKLLHGLCAAAGLELECAGHTLRQLIGPLQKQAAAIQTARWSDRDTSSVPCSTGYLRDAASRFLRHVAGGVVRTAGIKVR